MATQTKGDAKRARKRKGEMANGMPRRIWDFQTAVEWLRGEGLISSHDKNAWYKKFKARVMAARKKS